MRVRDLLSRKGGKTHSIKVTDTVRDLVRELVKFEIGALVVLDETNQLCGIVSERDILRLLDRADGDVTGKNVREIMTKDVVTASSDDGIQSVMEMMMEGRFRHLPVLEGGEIVGIISIRDVVEALANDLEYENQVLKEYVMGVR
jgi:CBS domain-containing protein